MPKERGTYVITASVFVDDVYSPEEAARMVDVFNERTSMAGPPRVEIRLPDLESEHKWEKVGG